MKDAKGRFVKGHAVRADWVEKSRMVNIGKKHSEEWKQLMTTKMGGRPQPTKLYKKQTDEQKRKNREAQLRRYDVIGRNGRSADYRERRTKRYEHWVEAVLTRDDFRCRITGLRGVLSAHHIKNFADNVEQRYELENGFTMLKKLHYMFHSKYGFGNNTEEQLEKFIRECQEDTGLIDQLGQIITKKGE